MRWVVSNHTITLRKKVDIQVLFYYLIMHTYVNNKHITQTNIQAFKGLYLQLSNNFYGFANKKILYCIHTTKRKNTLHKTPVKTCPRSQKYHVIANVKSKTLMLKPKS